MAGGDRGSAYVTSAVVRALADQIDEGQSPSCVHKNWIDCVKGDREEIILFATNSVERRAELLVCRHLLSADTRAAPLYVWSSRLSQLKGRFPRSLHLDFQAFLLTQALTAPDETAPIIFQETFDDIYNALSTSGLEFRAEALLTERLPHIGWFKNWNKCLRLQIAAVGIYRGLGLSKKKLRKITTDDDVRHQLEDIWSHT